MSFFAQLEKSVSIFYLVQNFLIVFKQKKKKCCSQNGSFDQHFEAKLKENKKYGSVLAYFLVY